MEIILNKPVTNSLTFKHISSASDEILQYIDDRRKGIVRSLKTRWEKLNSVLGGGFEENSIITVAGISGSGKSSFVNSLENDLIDLNPEANIVVLGFSFEMISARQVGRKLSYKLKKTTQELYNSDKPLSEEDFKRVEKEIENIKHYPIFHVDTPGTVDEIKNTILKFKEMYAKDKWLIVTFDHALLTKPMGLEKERETLVNLQRMFIEIKKLGKITIIQLSQLNREIEDKERINNPTLHFPQRRDLSGSDSLFQASDIILVIHRPELLGLKAYSVNNWPVSNMVYIHCLKVRDGEPKILSFTNNLKYNSIEEYLPIINQS